MSIIIILLQIVLGLLFVVIGSMTVAGKQMFVQAFQHFGYPQWFRVLIGSLEVLGGLGLLIGIRLPWLAALAGTGLALIMLGAVSSPLRTRASLQRVAFPFLVGVLAVVIAVSYWPMVLHG